MTVFTRCLSHVFAELLDEIALGAEAQEGADFRIAPAGITHKIGGIFDLAVIDIIAEVIAGFGLEQAGEVGFVQAESIGGIAEEDPAVQVVVDVGNRLDDLLGIDLGAAYLLHSAGIALEHFLMHLTDLGFCA